MVITGLRSIDAWLAEHTAKGAAIRYMENATNTVIRDLNHHKLNQLEEENMSLKCELKRANIKCQKLTRGCFIVVRFICSFSAQFHNLAILSYFGGQEVLSNSMKAAFTNIEMIARRMKCSGIRLENKLEKLRRCS